MDNRKLLYKLPEYRVLDTKRRKLIGFHLLDGVAFRRAATMLNLNKTRESKRADVVACLAAFNRALDPDGDAQKWETIRRVEIMWHRGSGGPSDEAFKNVNLPFDGLFLTPDGKPVDAAGNPVPAPVAPVYDWERKPDLSAVTCCSCAKVIPAGTPRVTYAAKTVCPHCDHVWKHTGTCPTGPNDPNLTRIEPRWGLNVVTVPDYVAPLPEAPRG